jgi:hypothetical protein
MQACRGCPVMGAAMSSSYGRMLQRARRAGAPRKPRWATPEVTGGGFIGPFCAHYTSYGNTSYGKLPPLKFARAKFGMCRLGFV